MPSQTPEVARMLAAARQIAQVADQLSVRFAKALADTSRAIERELRPVITRATFGDVTALTRLAMAQQTRRAIQEVLTRGGFDSLARAATSEPFDRLADVALKGRRLARQAADLSGSMGVRLQTLQALHAQDLIVEGQALLQGVQQAVTRGVLGGRSEVAIVRDAVAELDWAESRVQTVYDTAVSIYGREVEALQAGDDPETRFLYAGPVDRKTRPFCRRYLGRVLTRAEIDALDNEQIDNVFLTGGGYNCRHVWMEIAKSSSLQDLAGTRSRVPVVADQLARLKEAA